MSELREYHFTDEQIDFILELIQGHAKHFPDENGKFMVELANQIEDQIVNHRDND